MKVLAHSGLLVFILLVSAQIGYSCTCLQTDIQKEIEATDYIFVAKIVAITEDKSYVPPKLDKISSALQKMIDTRKRYLIKFKILNRFKGVKADEIALVKYEQENSPCQGLSFEKGKTYLVLAGQDKVKAEVHDYGLCSRTQSFDSKSKDYKELLNLKAKKRLDKI